MLVGALGENLSHARHTAYAMSAVLKFFFLPFLHSAAPAAPSGSISLRALREYARAYVVLTALQMKGFLIK